MKRIILSLLVISFFIAVYCHGQDQQIKFNRFVIEDGLTSINCIIKDRRGFFWFGGTHGLYRYDGSEFRLFNHVPGDRTSLSGDNITCLFEDSHGFIWVGTMNAGLNKFDPYKEEFSQFRHLKKLSTSLSNDHVSVIAEDSHGKLWIGTIGGGLNLFDEDTYSFKHFRHNARDSSTISSDEVFSILRDRDGDIWITTDRGTLDYFIEKKGRFRRHVYKDVSYRSGRTGQRLIEDHTGTIWIGTEGDGLYAFDKGTRKFVHYSAGEKRNDLSGSVITDLREDSNGDIWLTTDGGGLNRLDLETKTFVHFKHNPYDDKSLVNNSSYSLFIDADDTLWLGMGDGIVNVSERTPFTIYTPSILDPDNSLSFRVVVSLAYSQESDKLFIGTGGGGLDVFDLKNESFQNFRQGASTSQLTSNIILSLSLGTDRKVLVGTFLGGVNILNFRTGDFSVLRNQFDDLNSLAHDHVFDIIEDREGLIWIATYGGGLDCYDPRQKKYTHFQYDLTNRRGIGSNVVLCLLEDKNENAIWLGTLGSGVQKFDKQSKEFTTYNQSGSGDLLNQYPVHHLLQDKNKLWISTSGAGLNLLNTTTGKITAYTTASGMPSNSVYGCIEDNNRIWCSTNKGIIKFNPTTEKISTFTTDDGLPTNDFESGAIVKDRRGRMFFGSKKGLVSFLPEKLVDSVSYPHVVLTDFTVLNEPVSIGKTYDGKVLLSKAISFTDQIELSHALNSFAIEYATPAAVKSGKVRFRHQLVGVDNGWVERVPKNKGASYSNVPYGEYVFKVQASTGSEWNDAVTQIKIVIPPPFWRTKMAYACYGLFVIGLLYYVYYTVRKRIDFRTRLAMETYKYERDKELYLLKAGFFTSISHELRTSLTLILGPLDHVMKHMPGEGNISRQLEVMKRNGQRLMHLINQLLDFRKIESGNMRLQIAFADVITLVNEIILSFQEMATSRHISLNFQHAVDRIEGWFDSNKVEIIVYNLLSNAFKYTAAGGSVNVSVKEVVIAKSRQLEIKISDTGVGIDKENLDKIFQPFYQINAVGKTSKGTGIGLSITKNLVEIHHGQLLVSSKIGKGSEFTMLIPIDEGAYTTSEMIKQVSAGSTEMVSTQDHLRPNDEAQSDGKLDRKIMLVVEDNIDIREYIRLGFETEFEVIQAEDGLQGKNLALEFIPDVIVSDVMMDKMDGLEMCSILKRDARTSHIPVVLLTARTSEEYHINGFKTGADDYVTKPFSMDILFARVQSLLETRRVLRERFRRDSLIKPSEVAVSNPEDLFLASVVSVIEHNISNSEFTVVSLSEEVGMSHSVLYRKILALSGMTANDFIKDIRLQRAEQLLRTGNYNISEVSDLVGFSNPKYFSTCFRAKYSQTPTEYARNSSQNRSVS